MQRTLLSIVGVAVAFTVLLIYVLMTKEIQGDLHLKTVFLFLFSLVAPLLSLGEAPWISLAVVLFVVLLVVQNRYISGTGLVIAVAIETLAWGTFGLWCTNMYIAV